MQTTLSRIIALAVPLAIYAGIMFCVFTCEPDWTARQTWAILLTGIVVLWYTWETMQLRFAAHAQRETQIRPYVILTQEPGNVSVLNVGNGAALHVHIDTVIIDEQEKIEIRFPKKIAILRPGESNPLELKSYKNGADAGDFFTAHLDPIYAALTLNTTVSFDNVELKKYSVTQEITPGNIRVSEIS